VGRRSKLARQLGISVRTVRSHHQLSMDKLDIHDTTTLTSIAVNWGMLNQ